MAMFKKRISEESPAPEPQWSSEQIKTSASVRPNLGEFGRKPQGGFADDVVTTSIHWVSFEDLPNKATTDVAVGESKLKWPSWKKGSAKFSKALSSPTLRDRPEPDLTGRISSICRPLSAYGSVRNMDRSIVTATVGYQTDKPSVEGTEHINSIEDRITFHNDSIDSGHEGNFDEEDEEHNNHQFSTKQCFSTEDNDSKCTDGRRPHLTQQVPDEMNLEGFPDQQAGLAVGIGDRNKDKGDTDGISPTRSTASNSSSSQGSDSRRQPKGECNSILHHGSRSNEKSGIDQTVGSAHTKTNPSCKSSEGTSFKEMRQYDSYSNEEMNSCESRDSIRSKEDYALFAQEASIREGKKDTEAAISSPKGGGLDQQASRCHDERRSLEDEGYLAAEHLSQEGAANGDHVGRHSRITQQACSTSDGEKFLQERASLEEIPGADQPMHPSPPMEKEAEEESEYCQCAFNETDDDHEVEAAEADNSSDDDTVSIEHRTESLQKRETSSVRQMTNTTDDDSCPIVEREDATFQHRTQERIGDERSQKSRNSSEALNADRQEQMFPSQMTSPSTFGSPPRLLSSGNPAKQPNSPRRRGSPRIDQIADKLLKNAVVLVERLPRSITDKASQKVKGRDSPKIDTPKAESMDTPKAESMDTTKAESMDIAKAESMPMGNSTNQVVDIAPTSRVSVASRNISDDLPTVAACSSKELREPPAAPPKKRDMKKLLPKPPEPQRYTDGMYPYVPNAAAIPLYPSAHGPVSQQSMPPPPPNGLQYQYAPHGAQYPLGSLQHYHDNGAHQRFYAPYPGVRPRYLPPPNATAGIRNATYPDALQTSSSQPLQQPNPSLVVRIREVGPESMLVAQNRALGGQQQQQDNVAPIYHRQQGAMGSSTAMHQRPRIPYHANESSSLQESRQGTTASQAPLAAETRKPPSLIDAVIDEMYERDESTVAQETSAWRLGKSSANRTERPVVPEVFVSPPARRLKENREVKSAMNLVDKMIEDAYFSSKPVEQNTDVPPEKEVRPFGHSRYSPPLTVSMSDSRLSVHSTPPAHPKDFMSALVARVVDEEYAKDDIVAAVPEGSLHDRQLQDNGSPYHPNLPGPMAKPQERPTANQKHTNDRCKLTDTRSDSHSSPEGHHGLSNAVDETVQDGQGREVKSNTDAVESTASDTQGTKADQVTAIPSPRNVNSEIPSESLPLENLHSSDSSITGSETQRPDLEAISPPHVDNYTYENGHRCVAGRAEPESEPLMPSQENQDGKECAAAPHVTNNGLSTEEKPLLGNDASPCEEDASSPSKTAGDSTSNEQSLRSSDEESSAVSKDLPRGSTAEVDSKTADQLSSPCTELAEATDLIVDEETASNDRDNADEDLGERSRSGSEVEGLAAAPNEQTGSGEVRGEPTSSALTDERDKSGPKRAGKLKGRKRVVEGRHKKSMTRVKDKAESSAASEARIAHEFPRHNWLMKHLMAEQQLVTNRKDPERKSTDGVEKNEADPNEDRGEEEEEPSEVEGKDTIKSRSKHGTISRDSSMESCTSLDSLSSTGKPEGEDDNVFPCPTSPDTVEKSIPTSPDQQEVSEPKSLTVAENLTEDSANADNSRGSGDEGLPITERAAITSTTARHSQEEPLNLSLKAARFVDFYNSVGSKNATKAPEGTQKQGDAAGAPATAEHVNHDTEHPADDGENDKHTKSPGVSPPTLLQDSGVKKDPSASPTAGRTSVAPSPKPTTHFTRESRSSHTPITVTVHTKAKTSTTRHASDSIRSSSSSSSENKPPREVPPAMGNVQDRPTSQNSHSMFSFEDVPKDERATRQDGHQGIGPKRPASPTVRCPPRKRSTVDSGVVCVSPYSPVSPSDKTTNSSPATITTTIHEETPKRRTKSAASLPETTTTTATHHQFAVPSQQAVLPSKKSASQTLRSSSSGQERPSVISAVPVTPPLPPRPAAPPPQPNDIPHRADQSVTAALLARLEVMTKNKVNIERELVNQELLLTELRKRVAEDKSGLLRKQSQEKEALLFHMRMTYQKLCEDIDYLMRSGPPKFGEGLKPLHAMAPNSKAPHSTGQPSQAIPIHRAQSDSAITLQAGGKIGGEANRWRETTASERRSSDGESSSDVQIIGQKGPTISNSLQDFRHVNPHIPPYLDPRYVADARQAALVYGNAGGQQYSPTVSTAAKNHMSPRSGAPRFAPYAQTQNDLAAATAAERRRQAHMDVKRAKQILNEHKSFVEKYSRPGEGNNPHNEVQLNAPPANTAVPQAPVQGAVQTSTIHPYPHGVPIHQAVTMAQVMPILPGDPSLASRSAAVAHMVGPDQRPLPAIAHQGMHPFYYINPGMPIPGYQQQPIPGQSPRVMNPVTQQLLSPPAGQQIPTSTPNHQLNNLRGAHRPPNITSTVSVNSKEPPAAAQHHPVLLPGNPTPGQMCHHHHQQQYGWPGQLVPNNAEMNAAYFAAHAAQHAAKVQSRAEAAMKRGQSVKDHLQRPNVVALPEMQQAAYLSKHFKPFVTAPDGSIHPAKTHPAHLQQARSQAKEHPRAVQQTALEAAYLHDVQLYHANNQSASVFRGNPMMRGPPSVENGQGSPSTMGPPRRDSGGIVSIADDEYHSCVVCNKEATFLCSGCRKAWYCSPTCQVQAWEKHSEDCL
ncbi:uncharacterized protein LOC118425545 [Branchiostoma floridae]|uniref:Uncharacterized protein LOC118425545 n=1 Tax=Branchiostoma floridae TaxID=7739 RepID=A0A9J7LXQ3_BRAFL|nr:uncharacterized protein LOC118425545 [Branchiostoma floridae]XP_035690355.1 uncharacterized protein LOC118425545 [Branchiostoma floridae]XP_035690356.1 uncharacterized protein LOC118425545 [Branchiostoma floridae]XP_035690357.1 uncharacterized protein LOC118425545 [Branchiostoma floridae]